jgi:hypothetical protein
MDELEVEISLESSSKKKKSKLTIDNLEHLQYLSIKLLITSDKEDDVSEPQLYLASSNSSDLDGGE